MAKYTKRRNESINTWQELSRGINEKRDNQSGVDFNKEAGVDLNKETVDISYLRAGLNAIQKPWWMRLFGNDSTKMANVKTALEAYTSDPASDNKKALGNACKNYITARLGERSTEVGQKRQDYVYRIWYCVDPEGCTLPDHLKGEADRERQTAEEEARKRKEEEEHRKKEEKEARKKKWAELVRQKKGNQRAKQERKRAKDERKWQRRDKKWRNEEAHSNGFSGEEKDAALKYELSKFEEADEYFDPVARKVYQKNKIKSHEELEKIWKTGDTTASTVVWDYSMTESKHINRILAGYEGPEWNDENYKGPGKVDIFHNPNRWYAQTYGHKIRELTDLISKSKYDKNVWLQSGQLYEAIEAFLNLKAGTLKTECSLKAVNGKNETQQAYEERVTTLDFSKYIGRKNVIYQFLSTSVVLGGGGTYNEKPVKLLIYAPKGAEMLYVSDRGLTGKEKGEQEIILQRGGTYVITNMYMKKDSTDNNKFKLFVEMELHPEAGYDKFQQTGTDDASEYVKQMRRFNAPRYKK